MKIQINSLCEKYYSSYISLINKNNKNISFIIAPSEFLLDLSQTVTIFLKYLWESPEFIAKVIINSDLNDVKNILFPLIYNRFYQNILSSKTIEENLLYVITILFKEKICKNKFENIENFDNYSYDFLVDELKRKNEIKKYGKEIIYEVVKKLEYDYYKEKIDINIDFKELKLNLNNEVYIKNNNKENFIINLSKEELEKIIKDTKEEGIKEYIFYLINKIEERNDINLFSNNILNDKISEENILIYYNKNIKKIIEFLDMIFEQIKSVIIPVELKYICKVIYVLILYKFPKAKIYEIYSFIGKNILKKLLIELFKEPSNILLTEFLISENTKQNLDFLLKIFSKLISLDLFENNEKEFLYTPFNIYFVNKISEIFKFYENIIRIELPKFIELYINDKLEENYIYDYFNENKNEILTHKSIVFSLDEINCLIKNIEKNKDFIFLKEESDNKILDIFNKLNTDMNKKLLLQLDKMNNSKKKVNYILVQDLIINPKYDFNNQKQKEYYYINELSKIENENDRKINNIIKTKNYISYILYNCPRISEFIFSDNKNIFSIFSELKNFLKLSENKIYFDYYINSLLDCFQKLDENYTKNDFDLLLNELINEIKKSIDILDFDLMSDYLEKISNCENKIKSIENIIKILNEIEINKKVEDIIYENKNVQFIFNYSIDDDKKILCKNISEFINNFNILDNNNRNIIIKNYLEFIYDILGKDKIYNKDKNELEKIKEKIYDFIFIKLYSKLYPDNPTQIDSIILMNCEKLSWVGPKHFIKEDFSFEFFINEIVLYFNQLDKERNPRKKLDKIFSIFEIISKAILFQGFESDDKNYIDILKYIIIYIKPKRFNSEIEYIQNFCYETNDDNLQKLKVLIQVGDFIKNISYKDLYEISEEEYNSNCSQALIENNNSDK